MKTFFAAFTLASSILLAPMVYAEDAPEYALDWTQLIGPQLRNAYEGQTLDLAYNTTGFAGKVHHTETHKTDGTTDYREGDKRLKGEWTLLGAQGREDRICYRYAELDPNRQHCFYIFREGRCLYGYSVRWFPTVSAIRPELWRVKGANRKHGPSCDISVS